jgi:DNA-binding phage protein
VSPCQDTPVNRTRKLLTHAKRLGAQIRRARKDQGVGVDRLAVSAGLLPITVRRAEQPSGDVMVGTVAQVAEALGLELTLVPKKTSSVAGSCAAENKAVQGDAQ